MKYEQLEPTPVYEITHDGKTLRFTPQYMAYSTGTDIVNAFKEEGDAK